MPRNPIEKSIILGDGTVLENSFCGYSGRDLWCWVSGKTMMECMKIFSDPMKTDVITSYYFVKGYIYRGFTELLLIQKSDNSIDVRLTWPEGGEHSVEEIEDDDASDAEEI